MNQPNKNQNNLDKFETIENSEQFELYSEEDYFDESSSLFYNNKKQEKAAVQYLNLLNTAKHDKKILGIIISGSRGKGLQHQFSDYDLSVIVDETDIDQYHELINSDRFNALGDADVKSIQWVRQGFSWDHWARYGLARLTPPVDKTGEIIELLQDYHKIPYEHIEKQVKIHLGGYINGIFRSLKSYRAGDIFTSRFMCYESMRYLLVFVFALHGRITPYPKYLKWEAKKFPLLKIENLEHHPISSLELIDRIEELMETAEVTLQQRLFEVVYELVYLENFGNQLEDVWGEDHINFIRKFTSKKVQHIVDTHLDYDILVNESIVSREDFTDMKSLSDLSEIERDVITALVDEVSADDQVSIILLYGSRAKRTHSPKSDIEFIAICDQYKKISYEFFYKDIPADLWSTSWEHLERMARREEYFLLPAGTYISAKVVYSRSEADRSRFDQLLVTIDDKNSYTEKHMDRAIEAYNRMKVQLANMQIAKFHKVPEMAMIAANGLLIGVSSVVAHLNQQYYKNNWGVVLNEAMEFEILPSHFEKYISILATSDDIDELLQITTELLESTRITLIDHLKGVGDSNADFLDFLNDYGTGALSYNNKIRKALKAKDIYGLQYAIHDFQIWMMHDIAKIDNTWDKSTSLKLYSDLLPQYIQHGLVDFTELLRNRDFKGLSKAVEDMEKIFKSYISENVKFDTFEDMRSFLTRSTNKMVEGPSPD